MRVSGQTAVWSSKVVLGRNQLSRAALKPLAAAQANPDKRSARLENVEGAFFVDHTCIDCDTCRWMAPETFSRVNGQSAVHHQPTDKQGRVRAMQALLSCPTYSIHAAQRDSAELKEAQTGLPRPVPGCPGVYHCGWHSENSYGAASYLIVRPEGNILVDCPRFNPLLVRQVEALGGVQWIFLTHKDDVADHDKWQQHFKATRILHKGEATSSQGTDKVEVQLEGEGPWQLPDSSSDVELIFTPGHTSHHVVLYHHPTKSLFSGDHLAADLEHPEGLMIYDYVNWFSVPEQVESVRKLLQYDFMHVLPGHGRPSHLRDAAHRLQAVAELVGRYGVEVGPEATAAAAAGAGATVG